MLFEGRAWVWHILYHTGTKDAQEKFVEWTNIILNGKDEYYPQLGSTLSS